MIEENFLERTWREVDEFFVQPNPVRSVFILVIAVIVAFFLSRYLARAIVRVAQFVAVRSDSATDELKVIKLRRVETYLSVAIALVRVIVIAAVAIFAWQLLSPTAKNNSAITAIGAGTVFVVLAGATIGPLLRDMTAGSTMIAENWFGVGDHVKVEPFIDVSGVVERVTLRSTKLRRLNGEVVWLHNQHIQGVHVSPRGIRTMSVDVLVRDAGKGMKLVENTVSILPVSPTTLVRKAKISKPEAWGEGMWRIVVTGQTLPGREWLLEDFLVEALIERDKQAKGDKQLIHKPMAHYTDPVAEKKFRRAVRTPSET